MEPERCAPLSQPTTTTTPDPNENNWRLALRDLQLAEMERLREIYGEIFGIPVTTTSSTATARTNELELSRMRIQIADLEKQRTQYVSNLQGRDAELEREKMPT